MKAGFWSSTSLEDERKTITVVSFYHSRRVLWNSGDDHIRQPRCLQTDYHIRSNLWNKLCSKKVATSQAVSELKTYRSSNTTFCQTRHLPLKVKKKTTMLPCLSKFDPLVSLHETHDNTIWQRWESFTRNRNISASFHMNYDYYDLLVQKSLIIFVLTLFLSENPV